MTLGEASRMVSFGLVVLIWLVQLVIYPAFLEIDRGRFVVYHAVYTRAVSWVVIPLMLGQVGLIAAQVATRPNRWLGVAVALVAVAWAATFFEAVPSHGRLQSAGYADGEIRRLVAANWVRTGAWTLAWVAVVLAR